MKISFSPPSISEREIELVIEVLKSGWITTGPKSLKLEKKISEYCSVENVLALNSATAGLELVLRLFDIKEGDEVITTPYTYAATANVILHCGARPVFVDIKDDDFNININEIGPLINEKTKAIIPVDIGGMPCDYNDLYTLVKSKQPLFRPTKGTLQEKLNRILVLSDAAHSFGAIYCGKKTGGLGDFNVFSFHAVKNLTTAEGGAVCFNSIDGLQTEVIYRRLKLLSLHGQSKDAFKKLKAGSWRYAIELAGYKCNMPDILAAIGLGQLERYDRVILKRRKEIYNLYNKNIKGDFILPIGMKNDRESSYHLYMLRLKNKNIRDQFINRMAQAGIAANVHYIPLPMHPLYKNLGYKIEDTPIALKAYEKEVSLPIYPDLNDTLVNYIIEKSNEIGLDLV